MYDPEVEEDQDKAVSSGLDRITAPMSSQQLQFPHKIKPNNIPAWSGKGSRAPPKLRSYQQLMASGREGVTFFKILALVG